MRSALAEARSAALEVRPKSQQEARDLRALTSASWVSAQTWHGRLGPLRNAFRYSVDFVLIDLADPGAVPGLFGIETGRPFSLRARDHGGAPGEGRGLDWVHDVLNQAGCPAEGPILLLTQPRQWGYVFNPVSFWLVLDQQGALRSVIAEVTNTFGDRHSYLCRRADGAAITPDDRLAATKLLHVSPFQPLEGGYSFRFTLSDAHVSVRIAHKNDEAGLLATLTGPRQPLTNRALIWSALRRPLGGLRVLALIHWQALKLWKIGARYRDCPTPPAQDVSS